MISLDKLTVFVFVFFCVNQLVYTINIKKLKLNELLIRNKTTHSKEVEVTWKMQCFSCFDHSLKKEVLEIAPGKNWQVSDEGNIFGVKLCNSLDSLVFKRNQSSSTFCMDVDSKNKALLINGNVEDERLFSAFGYEEFEKVFVPFSKEFKDYLLTTGVPEDISGRELFFTICSLYQHNNLIEKSLSEQREESRIPHIIHQIWFGGDLPIRYQKWRKLWRKNHAKWRVLCWSEKLLKHAFKEGVINQSAFDNAEKRKSYAEMADITRYELVYRYGGLYVDTDVQSFESIDILHNLYDFYVGLEPLEFPCYVGNAVIGAKPKHLIIDGCIKTIGRNEILSDSTIETTRSGLFSPDSIIERTGPGLLSKMIAKKANQPGNIDIVFPPKYFYVSKELIAKRLANYYASSEFSFCCHSFDGMW